MPAFAAALALTGCVGSPTLPNETSAPATTHTGELSPTAPAQEPTPSPTAMLSYLVTPTVLWAFSADQAGAVTGSDASFWDPRAFLVEDFNGATPIDAGDVWITAAQGSERPVLIGLSPETGEALWTYQGGFRSCALLVNGQLACMADGEVDTPSTIVLIDVPSGVETARFDLPLRATGFQVTGSDIVALMRTDPLMFDRSEVDWPENPYRVGRYTVGGQEVWATDIPVVWDGLTRDEGVRLNGTLVGVGVLGSHYLLDIEDGGLLMERSDLEGLTITDEGVLLVGVLDPERPDVTGVRLLDPGLSTVATLPGYVGLYPYVRSDGRATVLLLDPAAQVVELDTTTGATRPTGVTPGAAQTATFSLVGQTLLMFDYVAPALRAYDLGAPETVAWQTPLPSWPWAYTDGTLLYTTMAGSDGSTSTPTANAVAIRLTDGVTQWTLPIGQMTGMSTVPGPSLATAGGRLLVIDGSVMTALTP